MAIKHNQSERLNFKWDFMGGILQESWMITNCLWLDRPHKSIKSHICWAIFVVWYVVILVFYGYTFSIEAKLKRIQYSEFNKIMTIQLSKPNLIRYQSSYKTIQMNVFLKCKMKMAQSSYKFVWSVDAAFNGLRLDTKLYQNSESQIECFSRNI